MFKDEAYLLEIIVSDVELKLAPKTKRDRKMPRFAEEKSETSIWTAKDESKDNVSVLSNVPGRGELVAGFKLLHLPCIEVSEDNSKESEREKKEKKELARRKRKDEGLSLNDEIKRATAAGKTLEEWRNIPSINDNYLKRKLKKGKSCMFYMDHRSLINMLNTTINVYVYKNDSTDRVAIGTAKINFNKQFWEAVCAAHKSSVLRHLTSTVGYVYYPSSYYKSLPKKPKLECQCPKEKENDFSVKVLSNMEPYVRFKNVYKLEEPPARCLYCDSSSAAGGPYAPGNFDASGVYKPQRDSDLAKRISDYHADEEDDLLQGLDLLEPSPEPIQPVPLPTTAQFDEIVRIVDKESKETAVMQVFIRLSCFGTALYDLDDIEEDDKYDPCSYPPYAESIPYSNGKVGDPNNVDDEECIVNKCY